MPLHLLADVLSHLDNMQSLASAIFSHSSLYCAFSEDRPGIVARIITGQISKDLMKYAICTHSAAHSLTALERHDQDRVRRFLFDNFYIDRWDYRLNDPFRSMVYPTPAIDLDLAGAISRTHTMVQYFTSDLLRDTLPLVHQHLGLQRPDWTTASVDEEFRIQRAMYRFQMYCNLFRDINRDRKSRLDFSVTLHGLFEKFSPWANEQLGCINDYFERVLSRGRSSAHHVPSFRSLFCVMLPALVMVRPG